MHDREAMRTAVVLLALGLVGSTGCSVTAPRSLELRSLPTARIGSTEEAVKAAFREGAEGDREASVYLQAARQNLRRARALVREGEYDDAESLLLRSTADADAAATLAREHRASAEAREARRSAPSRW